MRKNTRARRLLGYINPIEQFGSSKYSLVPSIILSFIVYGLIEFYVFILLKNPGAVGLWAIVAAVTIVVYSAFRDGRRGGIMATYFATAYYFYILDTRNYAGDQLKTGILTSLAFGGLYLVIALIIGWLKQIIDQLIKKEADEKARLQAILHQLPVGVLIADANGTVIGTNNQLDYILGVEIPLGYNLGKENKYVMSKNGNRKPKPTRSLLMKALSTGKPFLGKEFNIERDDKKTVSIKVSASPIKNDKGEIIAAASIVSDISQQKELEQRKDDFINMASHELKTPITSMNLYIGYLHKRVKKLGDEKLSKAASSMMDQVYNLQELVDDLLNVSRIQTGKLRFRKDEFRLDELAMETIEALQSTTSQNILLVKKSQIKVFADKFRVYQVLTNILTNAIKYSSGNGVISVEVRKVDGKAVVSVEDQGIGIDKDEQKKIFGRLYQVMDPDVRTFPGIGMGLFISKEIIRRHGGSMWVESEKGLGSKFYFSLPLSKKAL